MITELFYPTSRLRAGDMITGVSGGCYDQLQVDQATTRSQLRGLSYVRSEAQGYPEAFYIVRRLKDYAKQGDLKKGFRVHLYIQELKLLEENCFVASALINMYAKCGAVAMAQQVLDELPVPVRTIVTWNALIAGYVQQGHGEEALKCYDNMQREGHCPNAVTFVCALQACGSVRALVKGELIHGKIVSLGILDTEIRVMNTLVDMYARCGALTKAQQLLEELPGQNVVGWTAVIAGYIHQERGMEALRCFDIMQHNGHAPDAVTFICALKACGSVGAVARGKQIHDMIVQLGMLQNDILLGNTLVDMYARCGAVAKAQRVHDELPVRNLVTWNALITGYVQQGYSEEALKCFNRMQIEGHSPDSVSFICALKACGNIGALIKGAQIHNIIVSLGLLETDIVMGNTLVDMYARCGAPEKAQQVLDELPVRNLVAWTALIAGYAEQGQGEKALKCFDSMQHEGQTPDVITFVYALKACGSIEAISKGEELHDKLASLGMLQKDIVLESALLDMYASCGALSKAEQVFNELSVQNVVSWTALIAGYVKHGQDEAALKCFHSMQCDSHSPDVITFICALKACGSIGAIAKGEQIHDMIVTSSLLNKSILLGNMLVDMHARCGVIAKAEQVFNQLCVCDTVSWSILIAGYAQQGLGPEALHCFERMQYSEVKPGSATLVCVLILCSHAGLLDQAVTYFSIMRENYGIAPDVEHYCSMVDVFGRAGKLDKTLLEIGEASCTDHLSFWLSLLSACQKWGDLKMGKLAFEHALELDEENAAAYIFMSNICTAASMQKMPITLKSGSCK